MKTFNEQSRKNLENLTNTSGFRCGCCNGVNNKTENGVKARYSRYDGTTYLICTKCAERILNSKYKTIEGFLNNN